jgi:hypothetical protein
MDQPVKVVRTRILGIAILWAVSGLMCSRDRERLLSNGRPEPPAQLGEKIDGGLEMPSGSKNPCDRVPRCPSLGLSEADICRFCASLAKPCAVSRGSGNCQIVHSCAERRFVVNGRFVPGIANMRCISPESTRGSVPKVIDIRDDRTKVRSSPQ